MQPNIALARVSDFLLFSLLHIRVIKMSLMQFTALPLTYLHTMIISLHELYVCVHSSFCMVDICITVNDPNRAGICRTTQLYGTLNGLS